VTGRPAPTVSIIVPVLDEQDIIVEHLTRLRDGFPDCERVVVDGGSSDDTVARAAALATVVHARGGRGPQDNAGAAAASGEVLWFVHADTRLDPAALDALRAALADPRVAGGGFRLRFDRSSPALRWLEWTTALRARRLGWVFGDQAMFLRREVFDAVGGFPPIPIMEDLELSRRLRRLRRSGHSMVVLPQTSTASARRFVAHGTVRMIVRMQYLKLLYFLGVAPEQLHRRYTSPAAPQARGTVPGPLGPAGARLRALERRTRPVDAEFTTALARRWQSLPEIARTPGQLLGRHAVGCEGTHGVFPRCNLACTPCYHSRDANRVRVDGAHTLREVAAQMALLRRERGPAAHAQLIGGEVSLLDPDDHAAALAIMRRYGREPMSMTHGDLDPDYLDRLAVGPDGRRRVRRLSFAVHVDSLMFGRRGIPRPPHEAALHPYRQRFVDQVVRLRREHGVRSFLAHNMTVTPANLAQIPEVITGTWDMAFGMLSFQPAAFLGDDRRWHEDYRATTSDQVWAEIERGAGTGLDYTVLANGDTRCNRTAYGVRVGSRWVPLLDGDDPRDLATRDAFFRFYGPVSLTGQPGWVSTARLARVAAAHPRVVPIVAGWLARAVRRGGGPGVVARAALRGRVRPLTFVMHQFMDAADVAPAWEATQRGELSDDPRIRGTQERLAACHYAMAHPETGTLVPACVQHALLDPVENQHLRRLLPLTPLAHDVEAPARADTPEGSG